MTDEQEIKWRLLRKFIGRQGVIRIDGAALKKNTKIYVRDINPDLDIVVSTLEGTQLSSFRTVVNFGDINFTDKEYSGSGISINGVRTEKKDKYKDDFVIELLKDNKTIQLSQALISLLKCNNGYVGFAIDYDVKTSFIFNAKTEENGYLVDKNGRIVSPADHRELLNYFNNTIIQVNPVSIIDSDNHPDYIFYQISGNHSNKLKPNKVTYDDLYEQIDVPQLSKAFKNEKKAAINKQTVQGLVDTIFNKEIKDNYFRYEPVMFNPEGMTTSTPVSTNNITSNDVNITGEFQP